MEISPTQLKERLDNNDDLVLLDVRDPHELRIANIEDAINLIHIPKGELKDRISEIEAFKDKKDIVVYCRTGKRSVECSAILRELGFTRVLNLTGGLHAWSDDVDCSVMKY